jgi:hypothetical protein
MKFILMSLLGLSLNAFAGGKTVTVVNPPAGKTDKKAATVAVAKPVEKKDAKAAVKKVAAKPAAKAAPAKVAAKAPAKSTKKEDAKRTPASAEVKGDVKFGTYRDGATEIVCGHIGNSSVSCVRTNP